MSIPRIDRALTQKLLVAYCEEKERGTVHCALFGSTGNAYTVQIQNQSVPLCDCPDFVQQSKKLQEAKIGYKNDLKLPFCKHIAFLFLRVLKFSKERFLELQTVTFNENYIDSKWIAQSAKENQNLCAPTQVVATLKKAQFDRRQPVEGDCSICYEDLLSQPPLVWCENECGANFHGKCIREVEEKFHQPRGSLMTCPLCRSPWYPKKKNKRKIAELNVTEEEGYLNLRKLTRQSQSRSYFKKKQK